MTSAEPVGLVNDWAASRLLGDVTGFAEDHWGRGPLLRRAAGSFGDLLDTAVVEQLLTDLGRRPTFRIVKAGVTIPTSEYTCRTRVGGIDIEDVADVDRILALVAGGATVVLQGLQRTWPPVATFCADLAATASHHVQANAYLSPSNAAGLSPHRDLHDVIVVQLEGAKCWDVEGLGEIVLSAGDVLYLPAQTRHSARSLDNYSLHLTIGIVATTRRRLVHRIVDDLDAGLDAPLPFGYARHGVAGSLAAELADVIRLTADELAKVAVDGLVRRQVARERRRRSSRTLGRLAATIDSHAINDATMLRRRPGLDVEIGADDSTEVTLSFAGRRLHLPAVTASAVDVIGARTTFAVRELVGLDARSRAVLARRVVREGLVEIDAGATPLS